jgi:hypothetical protein
MGVIKALDGNAAIAHGVMRSKVQLVAAYPITPQTPIVETIASLIDKKEYAATYITAESEHSAISAVVGAASTGVRTFTASASHGARADRHLLRIQTARGHGGRQPRHPRSHGTLVRPLRYHDAARSGLDPDLRKRPPGGA